MPNHNCNSNPVIIYPPTVDWDYMYQRPQQLLTALAKQGCYCFFGNPNVRRIRKPGFEPINNKNNSNNGNLILANNVGLNDTVIEARKYYPASKVIIYYSYPAQLNQVKTAGADMIIFDSLDEPEGAFAHWAANYTEAVKSADLALASAQSLLSRILRERVFTAKNQCLLVPNACDFEHFQKAQDEWNLKEKLKESIYHTGRPIIGFVGAVANWWLDWELLRLISEQLPDYDLLFIGPEYDGPAPLRAHNVHYFGFIEYKELPKYISGFDICIMPFAKNGVTRGVNPIKMWEYLATGKPIISTDIPEVKKMGSECAVIINQDNVGVVRDIVKNDTGREYRINLARENSWDSRAEDILEAIGVSKVKI